MVRNLFINKFIKTLNQNIINKIKSIITMKKLFILLLFVSLSTIIFSQQKEYYVGGIDLSGGDTLKFGMGKDTAIATVLKKIVHKDEYCPIDDTIVFDNVVVDNESYNIVDCYFGDGKLYKIIMKRYVGAEYINQIPEMKFNPEIQKELMDGEKFIVQQIFVDTKSKYNY